ncbi:MAG TPA: TolC family protein [Chitinophagaceae bacterium]|nr:TolC family protein [Chitinophagaceae bacterium]
MRRGFKWFIMLIISLLYILIAHRSIGQTTPLNIKTAIDIALTNNRSLRSDSLDIAVSNSKNKELAGFYKPQVNYSSSTEYNPAISTQMLPGSIAGQPDKELVPVQFGTRYSLKSGVEVTQTLYRKDLKLQIRNSGLQTKIAKTKYNLSKEELVYQVASLFYSLQTNAELIRTTYADYINLKEVLTIAKAQYENGTLKRIDFESLDINVANKLSQLNQYQTQYNDQLAHFNYLLGIPASNQTIINDSIAQDLRVIESGSKFLQREDIRLSYQMIESKENELSSIRAEKSPAINSYFRYNYQSQFNKPGKAFNSDYLYNTSTVGISVSIPIFDGNRRKSRINTAQVQLDQLKLQNQHKQDQARMEVVSATGTLNNSQEQYVITKQNLGLAEKVFSSRRALYTEGVTTLVELLDAERELSNARNLHIQALIDVQTSRLDLHKANGTLLTDFIKSI